MTSNRILSLSVCSAAVCLLINFLTADAFAQKTTITVQAGGPGKAISPLLMGVFFEDLSNAADGGLYAELVQNRSFEVRPIKQNTWNNLTAWELVKRGDAKGTVVVDDAFPIHPNNPHYVVLANETPGDGVCLVNSGFFAGIPVKAGEKYDVALFARQQFIGRRWGGAGKPGTLPLSVRLETKAGVVLGETTFPVSEREWRRFSGTITASQTDPAARLVLLTTIAGGMALDDVSLFPQKTFRNRQNGLRADLAQAIADLKPRFMRFPGGCLVHGNGLGNMYRWQDTIGPIEQRRQQYNLWGYHQTVGLGYYEYFQFCEDIGAKPLPVVAAGVCCQNSGHGMGQSGLPLEQMPAYIQEVLDLIEWANGPVTSKWGAKRAAAGHPAPFNLEYLGVGNEDEITPVFKERFKMIYDAVKQKHPEITVIGTVGPMPDGEDFEKGWKIADEFRVPMVDEHYYKSPQWFWENLQRYDSYDRTKSKVYVGEYAAHDDKRRSTQRSAIAEAAYLTSLERNGDVVLMSSYAPLLARRENTNWRPDLIYFNGTELFPTINYHVQQLFGVNSGEIYLETKIAGDEKPVTLAASAVRDRQSGDLILKFVNGADVSKWLHVDLVGAQKLAGTATVTVLAAQDASVVNEDGQPPAVQPVTSLIAVGSSFDYEAPANSLTIVRIKRP